MRGENVYNAWQDSGDTSVAHREGLHTIPATCPPFSSRRLAWRGGLIHDPLRVVHNPEAHFHFFTLPVLPSYFLYPRLN